MTTSSRSGGAWLPGPGRRCIVREIDVRARKDYPGDRAGPSLPLRCRFARLIMHLVDTMIGMSIEWSIEHITDPHAEVGHWEAVEEIKHAKLKRQEMFRGALYTYRVLYVTRLVGGGADQFSRKEYARQLEFSAGYVTLLDLLGRALVVHRVPHGSQLWSELSNEGAKHREIAALLRLETPVSHNKLMRAVTDLKSTRTEDHGKPAKESPQSVVHRAAQEIRDALPVADRQALSALEEMVGDLFFDIREARKATG